MPTDKVITQTNFVVLFTSRSLPYLGEIPGHLIWHLSQVFICHQLSTNCILSLQIQHDGQLCLLFSGLWSVGEGLFINLGMSGHLSTTALTACDLHNSIRALLSHQPKGPGDVEKFHDDIAFLLVSTKEEVTGLTALVSSGPNWPYALVWLNEDACNAPLPREGHLGILPEEGTNRTTCRQISQLEVW